MVINKFGDKYYLNYIFDLLDLIIKSPDFNLIVKSFENEEIARSKPKIRSSLFIFLIYKV